MKIDPRERKGENPYTQGVWRLFCTVSALREASCKDIVRTVGGASKTTIYKMQKTYAAMVRHGVDPKEYTWISAWWIFQTMM